VPEETVFVDQLVSSNVCPNRPLAPTTDCQPPLLVPLLVPLEVPLDVPLEVPLDVPPLLLLELPAPATTPPPPLELLLLLASSPASSAVPPLELLELELELELDEELVAGAEASAPPGLLGELLEHATVTATAASDPRAKRIPCARMVESYGGDGSRATSQIEILSFPIRIR
jgi:hypothetical protein